MTEQVPEYMVPSDFVLMDALPLSPNGKLDRRALPAPGMARPVLDRAFVPPTTSTEQVVAEIWTDVLGLEKVGVNDNFFDLGGHSLLATQVVSRIRVALEIDLPLRAMFEAQTVSALSERIDTLRWFALGLQETEAMADSSWETGEI
jgi:acyl carrier protein